MKNFLIIFFFLLFINVKPEYFSLTFEANQESVLKNPYLENSHIKCDLEGEEKYGKLKFKINHGKARVDGKHVKKKEENYTFILSSSIFIDQDIDSIITIVNLGEKKIEAKCNSEEFHSNNNLSYNMKYKFIPGKRVIFSNIFNFPIQLYCVFKTIDTFDYMIASMIKGKSYYNGDYIDREYVIKAVNNERFIIKTQKNSSAQIINQGKNIVEADCRNSPLNIKQYFDIMKIHQKK